METRIEVPDSLYPKLAAASSAEGVSFEAYVVAAAKEKLGAANGAPTSEQEPGAIGHPLSELRAHLDDQSPDEKRATRRAAAEVQAITDQEFSKIDPEMWE